MNASRPLRSPRAIASQRSESIESVTVGSIGRPVITVHAPSRTTTVHCPGSRPDRSNRITASIPAAADASKICGSPATAADAVVGWKVVTISPPLLGPEGTRRARRPQVENAALRVSRPASILNASPMRTDRAMTERILNVLRPYASNWSGTLGRGDLVIPQREIPRVIHEILDALRDETADKEAGEQEVFDVLMSARRSPSVQDQVNHLRRRFRILQR